MDRAVPDVVPALFVAVALAAGLAVLFADVSTGVRVAGVPLAGAVLANALYAAGFAAAAVAALALGEPHRAAVSGLLATCWVGLLVGIAADRPVVGLAYVGLVLAVLGALAARSPAWRRALLGTDALARLRNGDRPQ